MQLVLSVSADYQLEIRLLSFTNPGGRTDSGACCESDVEMQGMCPFLFLDTCDTQFSIQIDNFNRLEMIGQPIVLSEYMDLDSITFPYCGELVQGRQNPLIFIFPTTAYNAQVVCLAACITKYSKTLYLFKHYETDQPQFR